MGLLPLPEPQYTQMLEMGALETDFAGSFFCIFWSLLLAEFLYDELFGPCDRPTTRPVSRYGVIGEYPQIPTGRRGLRRGVLAQQY